MHNGSESIYACTCTCMAVAQLPRLVLRKHIHMYNIHACHFTRYRNGLSGSEKERFAWLQRSQRWKIKQTCNNSNNKCCASKPNYLLNNIKLQVQQCDRVANERMCIKTNNMHICISFKLSHVPVMSEYVYTNVSFILFQLKTHTN